MRGLRYWNRCREGMNVPSLEVFMARLDRVLSHPV